jgi:thioesterase domain-containing protein
MNGTKFTPLATAVTGAAFEWQLAVIERADNEITAELQYDASRYSSETIRTALRHYERLLSEALFYLDMPVSNISLATSEEITVAAERPSQLLPISKRALGIDMPRQIEAVAENTRELAAVSPRNDEEILMANLWQQAFRRDAAISVHANFFDLGGHSLILARLQGLCHKTLGKRIYAADLFAAPTIALLSARLNGTDATVSAINRRLIPLQPNGIQPPLFLISQSMVFRRVAECLGSDQPVLTVQLEDEALQGTETFEEFARFYVNTIREYRPHGPYRIGGWCAAALVAYEVAQQLRALGETVEMLMLVDAWAPGYWRDMPARRKFFSKANYYWARFQLHRQTLATLSSSERSAFFRERARLFRASITRQMGSISFLRRDSEPLGAEDEMTLVDQVQYAASLKYHAHPWSGKALLFRSAEQPRGKFLPEDMGWGQMLTEKPELTNLPGDHRRIFEDPGAQVIAAAVQTFLSGKPAGAQVSSPAKFHSTHEEVIAKESCALLGF